MWALFLIVQSDVFIIPTPLRPSYLAVEEQCLGILELVNVLF